MPTLTPEQEADYRRLIDAATRDILLERFTLANLDLQLLGGAIREAKNLDHIPLSAVLAYVRMAHRRGLTVPLLRGVEQIVASLDPDLPVEHDPYPPSEY